MPDDATESADPRLVIDVAVSGKLERRTFGTGELALSGSHGHSAVHPVYLSKLQGCAGLVFADVLVSAQDGRRRPFRCVS